MFLQSYTNHSCLLSYNVSQTTCHHSAYRTYLRMLCIHKYYECSLSYFSWFRYLGVKTLSGCLSSAETCWADRRLYHCVCCMYTGLVSVTLQSVLRQVHSLFQSKLYATSFQLQYPLFSLK